MDADARAGRFPPLLAGARFLREPRTLAVLLLGLLIVAAGLALMVATHGLRAAPPLAVTTLEGEPFRIESHRGTVVVVDLMAVDCPPCRGTTEALVRLSERHGGNGEQGLVILSVDVWNETEVELAAYRNETASPWRYALGPGSVQEAWGAYAIPKVVVVDRFGHVAHETFGNASDAALATAVDKALEPPAWHLLLAAGGPSSPLAGALLLLAGPLVFPLLAVAPLRDAPSRRSTLAAALASGFGLAAGALAAGAILYVSDPAVGAGAPLLLVAAAALATITLGLALMARLPVPGLTAPMPRGGPRVHALAVGGLHGAIAGAATVPFLTGILGVAAGEALPRLAAWAALAGLAGAAAHFALGLAARRSPPAPRLLHPTLGLVQTVAGAAVLALAFARLA